MSRPNVALFLIKYLMMLVVGIPSVFWVGSKKTCFEWASFFHGHHKKEWVFWRNKLSLKYNNNIQYQIQFKGLCQWQLQIINTSTSFLSSPALAFLYSLSSSMFFLCLYFPLHTAVWSTTVDRCFRNLISLSCCYANLELPWCANPVAPPHRAPPPTPPPHTWPCWTRNTAVAAVRAACTAKPAVSTAAGASLTMAGERARADYGAAWLHFRSIIQKCLQVAWVFGEQSSQASLLESLILNGRFSLLTGLTQNKTKWLKVKCCNLCYCCH